MNTKMIPILSEKVPVAIAMVMFIISVAYPPCSFGQPLPLRDDDASKGKAISGELPPAFLKIAGVTIGKDTIAGVKKRFGEARTIRNGPGEGASQYVCYKFGSTSDAPTVLFMSGSAGGWKTVTEIEVGRAGDVRQSQSACRTIDTQEVIGELQLSMSKAELLKKFQNQPSLQSDRQVEFNFHRTRKVPKAVVESTHKKTPGYFQDPENAKYDIYSGVKAQIADGKVRWFMVYRAEEF